MSNKSDRTKTAILKSLSQIEGSAGASRIRHQMLSMGLDLQPRTIRLYLMQLDREGMTRLVGRRSGREITELGRQELAHANVVEKVGFVAAKVENLSYRMTFTSRKGEGTIITNVAVLDERVLAMAIKEMKPVFKAGLGFGTKVCFERSGGRLGEFLVPPHQVAIGTVCSVTVNGIMLHENVPVTSRFGGLLEMRNGKPVRFVEVIEYAGTSLDPLEAFIKAGMTEVGRCARNGSGIIGASFREVPSAALDDVRRIQRHTASCGLDGIIILGMPGMPLLDIPVGEGRAGMVVMGGLNPIAAVYEAGIRVDMASLAGLEAYGRFREFSEVAGEIVS